MDLAARKSKMIELIKEPITFNILDGVTRIPAETSTEPPLKNPMPVICIINGAGGNGKDTFVDSVGRSVAAFNISSVDVVRHIDEELDKYLGDVIDQMTINPVEERKKKSNLYRKFLSDVKRAWEDYCDGPTWSMINSIDYLFRRQMRGYERHDIIFLHIREPRNIDKMKALVEERYGAICLTLIVSGLVDPKFYDNDSDRFVENYEYDLRVVNTPADLNGFRERAALFGERIHQINSIHGVELVDDPEGTEDLPEQSDEM